MTKGFWRTIFVSKSLLNMKKLLLIYAMGATLLLIASIALLCHRRNEMARLHNNIEALSSETKLYKNRYNESAASMAAIQLKLDEFRQQHARDAKRIKALGLQLRRVESIATVATRSETEFIAPRHDTIILQDTITLFRWSDAWMHVEGIIRSDSVHCKVESVDTLRQIVHRVPHRFWFIRYGTKAIRQEITTSNPHSNSVYAEYIELPKRLRRRKK